MDATTMQIEVMSYETGDRLGTIDMDAAEWERYAACEHPDYQWPEGLATAGDVISGRTLDRLGIDPRTTIWLDD